MFGIVRLIFQSRRRCLGMCQHIDWPRACTVRCLGIARMFDIKSTFACSHPAHFGIAPRRELCTHAPRNGLSTKRNHSGAKACDSDPLMRRAAHRTDVPGGDAALVSRGFGNLNHERGNARRETRLRPCGLSRLLHARLADPST